MNTTDLLKKDGPVAIVIRERLRPVGGEGAVIFPPTYAPDKESGEKKSGYNIGETRKGKRCTIDSVPSQANRLEEIFKEDDYSKLVPQITITAGGKKVNLLDAAHRLADAAVIFSSMGEMASRAYTEYATSGNATAIARLSPMSLLFGSWDSRGTQAQIPRIFSSVVYADNIEVLSRSAQFIPSFTVDDILAGQSEEELDDAEHKKWSKIGMAHAPAKGLGGVIAHDGVWREATVNLVALRRLKGGEDTEKLQQYILGLALLCATYEQDYFLRSGCQLVIDGQDACKSLLVYRNGTEQPFALEHPSCLQLARKAAKMFGVGASTEYAFSTEKATTALDGTDKKKSKGRKSKGQA